MPLPLWSPSEVLQLDPNSSGFTCIGYAPSKGRRCHNPIASANRQAAANILREMSMLDPHSKRLDKRLEELAPRLLCQRWHQNQAADMKALWRREIDRHHPATVRIERYTVVYAPSVSPPSTLVRTRAKPPTTGQTTSSVAHSPVQMFASDPPPVAPITEPTTTTRRSNIPNRYDPPQPIVPNPTPSTQPHSTLQARNPPPQPTSPPPSPLPEPTHNTPAPAPPSQETLTTTAESPPQHETPPPEPIPSPTQNLKPHEEEPPTRRPLEPDCPICCEELSADDASVWCKAQCGQNFHKGCMETWHGFQEVKGRKRACPYCRAEWVG